MAASLGLGVDPTAYLTGDPLVARLWERAVAEAWDRRTERDEAFIKALANRNGYAVGRMMVRVLGRMFR